MSMGCEEMDSGELGSWHAGFERFYERWAHRRDLHESALAGCWRFGADDSKLWFLLTCIFMGRE